MRRYAIDDATMATMLSTMACNVERAAHVAASYNHPHRCVAMRCITHRHVGRVTDDAIAASRFLSVHRMSLRACSPMTLPRCRWHGDRHLTHWPVRPTGRPPRPSPLSGASDGAPQCPPSAVRGPGWLPAPRVTLPICARPGRPARGSLPGVPGAPRTGSSGRAKIGDFCPPAAQSPGGVGGLRPLT